jgi:hypothetical protein
MYTYIMEVKYNNKIIENISIERVIPLNILLDRLQLTNAELLFEKQFRATKGGKIKRY